MPSYLGSEGIPVQIQVPNLAGGVLSNLQPIRVAGDPLQFRALDKWEIPKDQPYIANAIANAGQSIGAGILNRAKKKEKEKEDKIRQAQWERQQNWNEWAQNEHLNIQREAAQLKSDKERVKNVAATKNAVVAGQKRLSGDSSEADPEGGEPPLPEEAPPKVLPVVPKDAPEPDLTAPIFPSKQEPTNSSDSTQPADIGTGKEAPAAYDTKTQAAILAGTVKAPTAKDIYSPFGRNASPSLLDQEAPHLSLSQEPEKQEGLQLAPPTPQMSTMGRQVQALSDVHPLRQVKTTRFDNEGRPTVTITPYEERTYTERFTPTQTKHGMLWKEDGSTLANLPKPVTKTEQVLPTRWNDSWAGTKFENISTLSPTQFGAQQGLLGEVTGRTPTPSAALMGVGPFAEQQQQAAPALAPEPPSPVAAGAPTAAPATPQEIAARKQGAAMIQAASPPAAQPSAALPVSGPSQAPQAGDVPNPLFSPMSNKLSGGALEATAPAPRTAPAQAQTPVPTKFDLSRPPTHFATLEDALAFKKELDAHPEAGYVMRHMPTTRETVAGELQGMFKTDAHTFELRGEGKGMTPYQAASLKRLDANQVKSNRVAAERMTQSNPDYKAYSKDGGARQAADSILAQYEAATRSDKNRDGKAGVMDAALISGVSKLDTGGKATQAENEIIKQARGWRDAIAANTIKPASGAILGQQQRDAMAEQLVTVVNEKAAHANEAIARYRAMWKDENGFQNRAALPQYVTGGDTPDVAMMLKPQAFKRITELDGERAKLAGDVQKIADPMQKAAVANRMKQVEWERATIAKRLRDSANNGKIYIPPEAPHDGHYQHVWQQHEAHPFQPNEDEIKIINSTTQDLGGGVQISIPME
jgi:hypothetical protein